MKILVAIRVPSADVHEVIQVHRRYLVQLMQEWTRIKESGAEGDLNLALAVDAELFRLDSVVRWLDSADGRLKRAAAETAAAAAAAEATQPADRPVQPATAPLPKQRRRIGVQK
jgi:hypothetical protein